MRSVSIILPCYNEEKNIAASVNDVGAWIAREELAAEIIVVNDGSTDASASVLEGLRPQWPQLRVVTMERNSGYGLAVRAGCDAAANDLICFMDSDGQFRADDLRLLLGQMDRFAFATGRRRKRADPLVRNIFGKVLGLLIFVSFGVWLRDVNCGMKMFHRDIWLRIRPTRGVEKLFNAEMFLRLKEQGIAWTQVDVPHYPRLAGQPTGAKLSVILRMFSELWALKRSPLS